MTLIDAAFWAKIGLRVGIIVLVLFVGSYYGYILLSWRAVPQSEIFKPDYACGTLPELQISEIPGTDLRDVSISVEAEKTILTDLPPIVYVYKLDISGQTFSTQQRASAIAQALSFRTATTISPDNGGRTYSWRDNETGRYLEVDTATLNFNYSFDLTKLPAIGSAPATQTAEAIAEQTLRGVGVFDTAFSDGKKFSYPITLTNNQVKEARSVQEAHVIRVDFQKATVALRYDKQILSPFGQKTLPINFIEYLDTTKNNIQPANLKEYKIQRVSQTPVTGNMQVYIQNQAGTNTGTKTSAFRIVSRNWQTEVFPCGTYPIIQAADAVRLIKEGTGKLVYAVERGGDRLDGHVVPQITSINVTSVYLGYLETFDRQEYLQPVYVAEGEAVFANGSEGTAAIYIPALE